MPSEPHFFEAKSFIGVCSRSKSTFCGSYLEATAEPHFSEGTRHLKFCMDCGWIFDGLGWVRVGLDGFGRTCTGLGGFGWTGVDVGRFGWTWADLNGFRSIWVDLQGFGWILDGFWMDFGWVFDRYWMDFGWAWLDFGWILSGPGWSWMDKHQ